MSRPRKHNNNAAKQLAYRRRNQQPQRDRIIRALSRKMIKRISGGYQDELDQLTVRELKTLARIMGLRVS